jgi:hypothetical protein
VTHTHLREGWPVEAGEDRLVVGFAKEFHAVELGKRPDHLERVNAALAEVFGRKLRIDPQIRPDELPVHAHPPAVEAEEGDTAVDLVRKGLGAEVVDEVKS